MRRREMLLGAAAITLVRPVLARAQSEAEEAALAGALRFEHETVFAYDAIAPRLDPRERALAETLRAHEAAHAKALAKALRDRGWTLPRPPEDIEGLAFPQIRAAVERGDADALAAIERLSEDVYVAALGALRDAQHIQLAATILAAEAAHRVAWRTVR